ncbi:hypothetical protein QL285_069567 [Trifolium repens]|nr:hypothetical protein QL285_069567 [Trifolium repens]
MKAIKWTPIPFIEETRSLCHSTDKPFPRQELNMINHLFYVYLFVIKDTLVLILPQNPHNGIPNQDQPFFGPFIYSIPDKHSKRNRKIRRDNNSKPKPSHNFTSYLRRTHSAGTNEPAFPFLNRKEHS